MSHAKRNVLGIATMIVCLLAAMPAPGYILDAGSGGSTPSFQNHIASDDIGMARMARMRIPFTANRGQMDERVKFHART